MKSEQGELKFTRTGVILCTERYQECVAFYSEVLSLPIMFVLDNEYSQLTCCDMGNGNYLMIEKGGKAVSGKKSAEQNPVRLRFNVDDVAAAADVLSEKNVAVTVRHEKWGSVADFTDPDGNICALRDEATFGS